MTEIAKSTVLFVDDEANILASLKRLVRKRNYNTVFASSGPEALEIMQSQQVDLVVSDMKMPHMTGAQLLAKVVEQYPDTYRIILSGYADLASTIDAVNEGKIHRFMQKPWQNDMLIEAIEEGLEMVRLKRQNENYRLQIASQNKKLKLLNESLEEKVTLRTRQIHAALKKLQGQNRALEKVLYNVININPGLNGDFAKKVSALARRIAIQQGFKDQDLRDIGLAGLLCEIGLMALDPFLYSKPFEELNHQQRSEYYSQVETARLILAPADYMNNVANILEQQFLPWAGGVGDDNPIYESILCGARILHIARDYWSYRLQKIRSGEMSHEQALVQMKKLMGSRYQPELIEVLLEMEEDLFESADSDDIKTSDLKAGMVLKENLYTPDHILILTEGHQFTDKSIEKVCQFEKRKAISLRVQVM